MEVLDLEDKAIMPQFKYKIDWLIYFLLQAAVEAMDFLENNSSILIRNVFCGRNGKY